jgi:carboxyl-terminal processing protease
MRRFICTMPTKTAVAFAIVAFIHWDHHPITETEAFAFQSPSFARPATKLCAIRHEAREKDAPMDTKCASRGYLFDANMQSTSKHAFPNPEDVEWRKVVSAGLLGLSLVFSPLPVPESSSQGWVLPSRIPSARAIDESMESAATSTASDTPQVTGSPLTAGTTSSLLPRETGKKDATASLRGKAEIRPGVLDEVWRLAAKYYIDPTFNNVNWEDLREKYEAKDDNPPLDGDKSMKLATEMISLLGDKYSRVLDGKQYSNIQKFDLIGVGATLMPDENKKIMVGAPPLAGSAADKAGLKVGDLIMAVNGKLTAGRNSFNIIDQIEENPNAKTIRFTVAPGGNENEQFEAELERSFMEVKDPVYYKLEQRPSKIEGAKPLKVGYVRIREFNALVKTKLAAALQDLENQGANAYVLDLRSNPGGAFQSAVELAGLFMEDKVATYVVDNNEKELAFRTSRGNMIVDPTDPIVIWLDKRSASASEVFAGAMHDNCRAVLMGPDRSFGKGVIQAVYGLKNGSGLVLTVAKYVTPSGTDIQGTGIAPDIKATLPLIPGLTSDTSMVDFDSYAAISKRTCPANTDSWLRER